MKVKTDYDDLKVKAIMNNMKEGESIEDELHKTMDTLYEQVPGEVRAFISALNGENAVQDQKVETKQKDDEKLTEEPAPKRASKKQKETPIEPKMEDIPQLHM